MSELFPDNQTANRDELLTFIDATVVDFMSTRTQRDTTAFVADDGDLVEAELSPLEEFVVNAALYGVQCALMLLPDDDDNGRKPFTGQGRRWRQPNDDDE